jgi:hypothetical protein
MKIENHPHHPFGWLVSEEQMQCAELVARSLGVEHATGYNMQEDETWLRVTNQDCHVLLYARGEVKRQA